MSPQNWMVIILGFSVLSVIIYFLRLIYKNTRPRKARVYLICSVRNRTPAEEQEALDYVAELEQEGYEVRCPFRDTNQIDEIGLRITEEHETKDIIWADQIHIIWNPQSQGSLWDYAQARMARCFQPNKKIVLVNIDEMEITRNENSQVVKSYNNVLLADCLGLTPQSTGADLEKALAEAKSQADIPSREETSE